VRRPIAELVKESLAQRLAFDEEVPNVGRIGARRLELQFR
jgi:hypothetical protein